MRFAKACHAIVVRRPPIAPHPLYHPEEHLKLARTAEPFSPPLHRGAALAPRTFRARAIGTLPDRLVKSIVP
jgi:hypothetical protein